MAHELDDISRLLGNIESTVSALGRRFDRLEKRMDERDGTLADIQGAASELSEDLRFMKDSITTDIKPVTDRVRRWEQQGMGALAIIGVGGSAFGAGILWLLGQLHVIKLP